MVRYKVMLGLFLCIATIASAQTGSGPGTNKKPPTKAKSAKDPEAERILNERRTHAQSLLINLAADARNFTDQVLRARTQARIADALWTSDRDRARAMFRSAWEAAVIADQEGQERLQEDIRQTKAKTGSQSYAVATPPEIRGEVLRLAAKRDRTLGEEFLSKFKEQEEEEAANGRKSNPFRRDEAATKRLELARELLAGGDMARALQFADPLLTDVSMSSMDFLVFLREKDAAAADQRYAALLTAAAGNPQSDANTVSLLSSYVFTPHLFLIFPGTEVSSSQSGSTVPVAVSDELRTAFFRAAAGILLRPLAPPGQDQTTAGHDGLYLIIKRLLPLFEQYAPQEMTTALRAQLDALTSIVSRRAREDDNEWLKRGLEPPRPEADRVQSLLDRIDRAKTSAERDQLRLQLAMELSRKGDMRARDYTDKIDEMEMRNSARAFIDASLAWRAIEKKDIERAQEIARIGELTNIQSVWLLTQTAKLLAKEDKEKSLALLDSAAAEARRIDGSDPDRPRGFFAVTSVLLSIDPPAAWNFVSEAIKSSNSAENFTGEDGELTFRMISKGMNAVHQNSVSEFDVAPLFSQLAAENYEKAVELARGFKQENPRANAVIAIAQSVLSGKSIERGSESQAN